jgi:Na+/proline symporter
MSVTFLVGIVAGYTLFAPRLYALSRREKYVTPTDFLEHRFRSPVLNYLSAAIFAWVLVNYLLAQLIALGNAFSGFTQGQIPYWTAVVGGAAIVLTYVLLGGMRAAAWTDVLQGVLVLIVVLIWFQVGSPTSVLRTVQLLEPEKVANPSLTVCLVWLSNFLLLALGAPLYPQAIQRIYAAKRLRPLRNALAAMAVIPLFAATTVIFIGAVGIVLFPQLDPTESEQVTFRVASYLVESNALAYYPVLMVMMAVIAAIMSTADSCLLTLSSIFTKDFVARAKGLDAGETDRLLRWVPLFSVVVMALIVAVAVIPGITLWGLLIIKFEVLIQLSPAFVFGTLHDRDSPDAYAVRDILAGLITGLLLTLALYVSPLESLGGFHFGTVGVAVNYVVVVVHRIIRLSSAAPGR